MDILLSLLLHKQYQSKTRDPAILERLRPLLPAETRRGLAAIRAYECADFSCDEPPCSDDLFCALENLTGNRFPFMLLRMFSVFKDGFPDTSSPEGMFGMLKNILPEDMLQGMPDPATMFTMINIMKTMNESDDDADDSDDSDDTYYDYQEEKEDSVFSKTQSSFFKEHLRA